MYTRITNTAMMRGYGNILNSAMANLDSAFLQTITRRKFEKASEAPLDSALAYQYRKDYAATNDYIENAEVLDDKYKAQEDVLMQLGDLNEDVIVDVTRILNGTMSDDDIQITIANLKQIQENMVLSMNTNFSDEYIFGGSSASEAPFAFDVETNTLTYRGLDVDDPDNAFLLDFYANESIYVDLGFGLTVDSNGVIDPNSAFDSALPGINVLGYGLDDDGNKLNLITALGDIIAAIDDPMDYGAAQDAYDAYTNSAKTLLTNVASMGAKTKFLAYSISRLEDLSINIIEKINHVEMVDAEEAILNLEMAKYTYNAALQIGPDILQPSLLDFMN